MQTWSQQVWVAAACDASTLNNKERKLIETANRCRRISIMTQNVPLARFFDMCPLFKFVLTFKTKFRNDWTHIYWYRGPASPATSTSKASHFPTVFPLPASPCSSCQCNTSCSPSHSCRPPNRPGVHKTRAIFAQSQSHSKSQSIGQEGFIILALNTYGCHPRPRCVICWAFLCAKSRAAAAEGDGRRLLLLSHPPPSLIAVSSPASMSLQCERAAVKKDGNAAQDLNRVG